MDHAVRRRRCRRPRLPVSRNACGVPVLLSPDIGDYSRLITEARLGGVVDIAESNDVLGPHLATLTEAIIADPDCRLRARNFAEHSLSLDSVG